MGTEDDRLKLAKIEREIQPDDPLNIQYTSVSPLNILLPIFNSAGNYWPAKRSHSHTSQRPQQCLFHWNSGWIQWKGTEYPKRIRHPFSAYNHLHPQSTLPLFRLCYGRALRLDPSAILRLSRPLIRSFSRSSGRRRRKVIFAFVRHNRVTLSRCTALYGTPTMFIDMLNHPEYHLYNYDSIRSGFIAGAPCPITLCRRLVNEMHMVDMQVEFGPKTCFTTSQFRFAMVRRKHHLFPLCRFEMTPQNRE